jgi:phosphodiesterase/alkaline phosphatase D-like protein
MLGAEQERWLRGQLSGTQARWKVIGQQMLMAQLEQRQGEGEGWWRDGWDGYPAGRRRILSQIAEQKIDNVVVIGGEIHSFWVADLKYDFGDPNSPPWGACPMMSSMAFCRRTRTSGSSRAESVVTSWSTFRPSSGAPTCGWSTPSHSPRRQHGPCKPLPSNRARRGRNGPDA